MTHPHDRALEAAALAVAEETDRDGRDYYALKLARAAVSAYLAEAGDGRLSELERENARLRADGKFLVDRLTDFERDGDVRTDDGQRDWDSHIKPALSRFRAALAGSGEK
jgi:hypothetical protein